MGFIKLVKKEADQGFERLLSSAAGISTKKEFIFRWAAAT
jgi:hypothetical protein